VLQFGLPFEGLARPFKSVVVFRHLLCVNVQPLARLTQLGIEDRVAIREARENCLLPSSSHVTEIAARIGIIPRHALRLPWRDYWAVAVDRTLKGVQ
jgi:hypothetical protein